MDPMTQAMLAELHVEDLLRERQPRHLSEASWHGYRDSRSISQPYSPRLLTHLRRQLAALLIQAGRRLGDGTQPRSYPLYGSAHR